MTGKPRPSVLDLFDPLLVEAVRVPIPESPPTTPQKAFQRSVEDKENLVPNELTMSVFFNRISRNTYSPTTKTPNISSCLLVELEDQEVGSEDGQTHTSPRTPLTELSVDDFSISANLPLNYGTLHKKTSQCRSSFSGTMPWPPSPLRQTQLASSPFPAISVNDSQDIEGSHMRSTHSSIDSVLPQNHNPQRECLQTSPSSGLLLPNDHVNSGHIQLRRRSSIDISTTLSSLSSSSFHMRDASFDLVNGEISFLNKSLEDSDTDHGVLVDSLEPQTPRVSLSPQTITSKESTLCWSMKHSSEGIPLTNTSAQPSIGQAEVSSESQLAPGHGQPTWPTGFVRTSREEHLSVKALNTQSTTSTGGQDTPPSARRVSSVPAPIKKLRVFTSRHHHTAFTVAKRGAVRTVATSSGTSLIATKKSFQGSTSGYDTSCYSGIPRGSAGHGAGVDSTEEYYMRRPAVSKRGRTSKPMTSNTKVPSRTVPSIEASTVHKEDTGERVSRISTTSRLPGPAAVRIGTHGPSRRPGSAQNGLGRSIPVRSTSLRSRHHQLDSEKPTAS